MSKRVDCLSADMHMDEDLENIYLSMVNKICGSLSSDRPDSEIIYTMHLLSWLANKISRTNVERVLVPCVKHILTSDCPLVREQWTFRMQSILCRTPANVVRDQLLPELILLINCEAQKAQAFPIAMLAKFCSMLSEKDRIEVIVDCILPIFNRRITDSDSCVLKTLLETLSKLTALLPTDVVEQVMIPVYIMLTEKPETQVNAIGQLAELSECISSRLISDTFPGVMMMAGRDPVWQVRRESVGLMIPIARTSKRGIMNADLSNIYLSWLTDDVAMVRTEAVNCLSEVARILQSGWLESLMVPQLVEIAQSSNYVHRITAVHAIVELAEAVDRNSFQTLVLPVLICMYPDGCPLVRLEVAKACGRVGGKVSPESFAENIVPALLCLCNDTEWDVRYFAVMSRNRLHISVDQSQSRENTLTDFVRRHKYSENCTIIQYLEDYAKQRF